ncbi:MAG: hypothetical protein KGI80_04850 [Verrucomicrobiota bacterium]|nr:hypothetical protein [Verrucomicrobiota bacterium]
MVSFLSFFFCLFSSFAFSPTPTAAVIKITPKKDLSYSDLPCTEQDRVRIAELITCLADSNYATLLLREEHLRRLGHQLNDVHPLKFLSVLVTQMKPRLKQVFEDSLKRRGFIHGQDGLAVNLSREAQKGQLPSYIAPFAAEVGVSPAQIEPFFSRGDWEGLASFLIYH